MKDKLTRVYMVIPICPAKEQMIETFRPINVTLDSEVKYRVINHTSDQTVETTWTRSDNTRTT